MIAGTGGVQAGPDGSGGGAGVIILGEFVIYVYAQLILALYFYLWLTRPLGVEFMDLSKFHIRIQHKQSSSNLETSPGLGLTHSIPPVCASENSQTYASNSVACKNHSLTLVVGRRLWIWLQS